jgi:hypothetical protein
MNTDRRPGLPTCPHGSFAGLQTRRFGRVTLKPIFTVRSAPGALRIPGPEQRVPKPQSSSRTQEFIQRYQLHRCSQFCSYWRAISDTSRNKTANTGLGRACDGSGSSKLPTRVRHPLRRPLLNRDSVLTEETAATFAMAHASGASSAKAVSAPRRRPTRRRAPVARAAVRCGVARFVGLLVGGDCAGGCGRRWHEIKPITDLRRVDR